MSRLIIDQRPAGRRRSIRSTEETRTGLRHVSVGIDILLTKLVSEAFPSIDAREAI
jgi:hypothetical protein